MESDAGQVPPELDVVVGLGANIGEPLAALRGAVGALGALGTLRAVSALYRTVPVGGPPQPDFLNAAVRLTYSGSAGQLLAQALRIERLSGRERRARWGPRTLDLDILWIRGTRVESDGLVVPHPRLRERAFALRPLLDVAPEAVDPVDGVAYRDLLAGIGQRGVEPAGEEWAEAPGPDLPRGMDSPCP